MSTPNVKIYQEDIPDNLCRALLGSPTVYSEEKDTVWEHLNQAKEALDRAIGIAEAAIRNNPLTPVLAQQLMQKSGVHGNPQIVLDRSGGSLRLEVSYEGTLGGGDRKKHSLPPISDLRKEAERLDIDWKSFGKNKTKLLHAIQGHDTGKVSPVKASSSAEPTPPAAPVHVPEPPAKEAVTSDDGLSELLSSLEESEAEVLAPPTFVPRRGVPAKSPKKPPVEAPAEVPVKLPPKRTPAKSPPRRIGGRTLSDLVEKAEEEVDLKSLLSKDAPSTPNDEVKSPNPGSV